MLARQAADCLTRLAWWLGGIVLAWLPFAPDLSPDAELIFNASCALESFEAALLHRLPALRKDLPVVLTLATPGGGTSSVGGHHAWNALLGPSWSLARPALRCA